jgi:hypothetical protein
MTLAMTNNNRKSLFFLLTNLIFLFIDAQSFSIGGYTEYEVTDNSKITFTIHRHKWQAVTFSYKDTQGLKLYIFIGNTKNEVYPTYKNFQYPQHKCKTTSSTYPFGPPQGKYLELVYQYTLDISKKPFDSLIKAQPIVRIFTQTADKTAMAYTSNLIYEPYHAWSAEINTKTMVKGDKSISFNNLNQTVFTRNQAIYSNPGIVYNPKDSVFTELVPMETDIWGTSVMLASNFSYKYPFTCYCPTGGNACTPKPNNKNKPIGFHCDPITGAITFFSNSKPTAPYYYEGAPLVFRTSWYSKDASGNWQFKGSITVLSMIFSFDDTKQSIRDIPNFEVPSRVDICEGDSATINITMSDTGYLDTIYVKIDGSLNPQYYRYTVDYSVKYLPKIKLFIKLPLGADFSTYRTLNVRLSTSPCDDIQVSSRGIVVYNQKSISSKIITYPGPCNSFKAQIKSNNNGMFVSNSWSVYKDSFGSKPIYTGKGDVITLTALEKAKYYLACTVSSPAAYCSQRIFRDSVDLIKLWPGLDFSLNRNTLCVADTNQFYTPVNLSGFAAKTTREWRFDTTKIAKDTLRKNFTSAVTLRLRIMDTAGCDFSKSFNLLSDSIYQLELPQVQTLCGAQSIELNASNPKTGGVWSGDWAISTASSNTTLGTAKRISVFVEAPKSTLTGKFTSSDGCSVKLTREIIVDTTTIRFPKVSVVCKASDSFDLNGIKASPKGGVWWNEESAGSTLKFNYATADSMKASYTLANADCVFTDSLWISLADTAKQEFPLAKSVCGESATIDLNTIFNPSTSAGTWYSKQSNLSISNNRITPRNLSANTYPVYYFTNTKPCGAQETHWLTVNPRVINILASTNTSVAQAPATINFEAKNSLNPGSTTFRWFFNDPTSGSNDSAQQGICNHTYNQSGNYYPFVIAKVGNCFDTGYCAPIQITPLSNKTLDPSDISIYPNPWHQQQTLTVQFKDPRIAASHRTLICYSAMGQVVFEKPLPHNGELVLTETLPVGVYFLKPSWSEASVKLVVIP